LVGPVSGWVGALTAFLVIARNESDEAIQQARAKATSKRRMLDCFAAARNDGTAEEELNYFADCHCEERSDAAIAMTKKGRRALCGQRLPCATLPPHATRQAQCREAFPAHAELKGAGP
jgi:hypothetical protein